MSFIRRNYANVASTVALVVALTVGGAWAAGKITSKDIQNGTIKRADLHKGAVTPKKAKFPPARIVRPGTRSIDVGTRAQVSTAYLQVADFGGYTKADDGTTLQVTWTGTVSAGFAPCLFQLRVDGRPPTGGGAEVYVGNGGGAVTITDQALFSGVDAGHHEVQVFARVPAAYGPDSFPCNVSPSETGIQPTVNAAELVQ